MLKLNRFIQAGIWISTCCDYLQYNV